MRPRIAAGLRRFVAALAWAMRPYLDGERGPTHAALELARNAVAVLRLDGHASPAEARAVIAGMIRHRLENGWATCGDVESAAWAGSVAWAQLGGRVAA